MQTESRLQNPGLDNNKVQVDRLGRTEEKGMQESRFARSKPLNLLVSIVG